MPRKFLKSWVRDIEKRLALRKIKVPQNFCLTIVFLNSDEAKKINYQYRRKEYATDVLSFLSSPNEGELILCPQVLKRQATEHRLSFKMEVGYMVLHGLLHLMGYEHEKSKKEAKVMFELQDAVFDSLFR